MANNIENTAKKMGFTPAYVRSLIRKEQLISVLEPIVPESLVKHHMVSDEEIKRFFAETRRATHRVDNRNKFVIYMTPVECDAAKIVLTENGLGPVAETIRTWNRVKKITSVEAVKVEKPRKKKAKHAHA